MRLDVTCSASWDSVARLDFDAHTSTRMTRATVAVDALPARFGKGTAVVVRRAVCTTLAASNYQSGAVRYTVRRCAWPSTSSAASARVIVAA